MPIPHSHLLSVSSLRSGALELSLLQMHQGLELKIGMGPMIHGLREDEGMSSGQNWRRDMKT